MTTALALWAGAAAAENWQLAGHQVSLDPVAEGGYRLVADGKVMLEDWLILSDAPATVAGQAVISGVAGAGGNICNAAPFLLFLPQGAPARLDGQIDTCSYLEPSFGDQAITWVSPSVPGLLTESWIWTPDGGFVEGPATAFAPDAGRGWESLGTLADQHPSEALRLEPVYDALKAGLGPDWDAFAERISGLGSGGLVGADYSGSACIKADCDTDFAGIWLDSARQQAFAYWRVSDDPTLHLYPPDRSQWPAGALKALSRRGG